MEVTNTEVTNGTPPVVSIKEGEANMYILAEGALGENAEGNVLLVDNSHLVSEIAADQQMVDTEQIAHALIAGNGEELIEE